MKRVVLILFFFIFLSPLVGHAQIEQNSPITDPSISAHCRAMLREREDKVKFRQKIGALILRNKNLQVKTPVQKKSILLNLHENLLRLEREYYLSRLQIQQMTENVIKRGCPGINL
ncbi:MAG: hypothetical protein WCG27_11635 [Pseudomonadota bacterium]